MASENKLTMEALERMFEETVEAGNRPQYEVVGLPEYERRVAEARARRASCPKCWGVGPCADCRVGW